MEQSPVCGAANHLTLDCKKFWSASICPFVVPCRRPAGNQSVASDAPFGGDRRELTNPANHPERAIGLGRENAKQIRKAMLLGFARHDQAELNVPPLVGFPAHERHQVSIISIVAGPCGAMACDM